MIRYETLMLTRTEITNEELAMLEKSIEKIVNAADGVVKRFDKWGKYRLAYPIQKSDYGIYIYIRYDVPANKIAAMTKELAQFFRIACSEIVMRHVNVRLDHDAPENYKKPESIETAGTGSVDFFLKQHKIGDMGPEGSSIDDFDDDFSLEAKA
jgi:small subunit ribosomal protein S6